jgi:hypothetical protein
MIPKHPSSYLVALLLTSSSSFLSPIAAAAAAAANIERVSKISSSSSSSSAAACQDDPHFQFQGVHGYTCDWISWQDENLCEWELLADDDDDDDDDDGNTHKAPSFVLRTIGKIHCPVSCGRCPREVERTLVFTDNVCYDTQSGGVSVSFENDDPRPGDWVGIYPAASSSLTVGSTVEKDPIVWSWLCDIGSKDATRTGVPNVRGDHHLSTSCKVEYNQVVFRQLPPGIYEAVLARFDDEIIATSPALFEILGADGITGSKLCSQRFLLEEPDTNKCKNLLQVDSSTYEIGQDIRVHAEHCEDVDSDDKSPSHGDFVAIYEADTDLEDIKGDANYRLWMWTCGSQSCHQVAKGSTVVDSLTFGPESNKHTWPLPPGSYQAHLVKHIANENRFASVTQSSVFTVEESVASSVAIKKKRQLQDDCLDAIRTKAHCYEEGSNFSVLLLNECGILEKQDWFGFYPSKDCSEADQICQGEPVIWAMACRGDDCQKRSHVEYRFKGRRTEEGDESDHEDDEDESSIVLPAGDYRVVLVADVDDHGEAPYSARLISKPMEIHRQEDSCHMIEQQS